MATAALQESMEAPEPPVTWVGVMQLRPGGVEADTMNVTVPVKPFRGEIVIVDLPKPPAGI